MTFKYKIVYGDDGEPIGGIFPWEEFLKLREEIGEGPPTEEELEEIREEFGDWKLGDKKTTETLQLALNPTKQ